MTSEIRQIFAFVRMRIAASAHPAYNPPMKKPERDLTQSERESFHERGVVIASGLFSQDCLDHLASDIDQVVQEPGPMAGPISVPEEKFSGDLFLWKTNDGFRDWIFNSPAAQIAHQALGGRSIRHFYDQLFVKPAGCHLPTPWHQDITFWPVDVESRNFCSIWITLDPVTSASSGLEFIIGSHRWPERFKAITPHDDPYMRDSPFTWPPAIDENREAYEIYSPELGAGDCLIFDAHILHGSSGNHTTDQPRRAFSSRWFRDEVLYDPRHATMPLLWTHGLERGDPLRGDLFPQVLPRTLDGECARQHGPAEGPDEDLLRTFLEAVASVPQFPESLPAPPTD